MKSMRVESLVYGAEDVAAGIRYWEDWGVHCRERSGAGADFVLPSGQTVLVRGAGDASLPPPVEAGSTMREVIWGVDGDAALDELGAELGRDREVSQHGGTLHTTDPAGFAIGFRRVDPTAPQPAEAANRLNHPFDPPRRATPRRIGHAVFNIPKRTVKECADFYLNRLQFRLTDRAVDLGDFMRAKGSSDHHNLFLAHIQDRAGFNHAAFEVRDFDEVVLGGKHMESRGWKPATRPGRHIMGSNLFWYFKNPSGGNTEYFADMDVMDDDWQPRIFEKNPGFSMWMMD
jgi:catechol 2,3-dioxygenase-like lactoylglutathione lyase family enzyme